MPPQQAPWLRDYAHECAHRKEVLAHTSLAADAADIVLAYLSPDDLGVLSDDQARQHRIKLMQEREAFQRENNKAVFERIAGLQEY